MLIIIALLLFSCATGKREESPSPQEETDAVVPFIPEEEEEHAVIAAEGDAAEEEETITEEDGDLLVESPEEQESPQAAEEEKTEEAPPDTEPDTPQEEAESVSEEEIFLSRVEELESFLFANLPFTAPEEEDETISFSGGNSSVVLREGKENVELTEGAQVTVGSMTISADEIRLSGNNWRYVECSGNVKVDDEERGISILTSSLWYDREDERILVTSWYEIEDRTNEVSASGAVLEYRLDDERLQMDKDVLLLRAEDDGLMRCRAESVVFSRKDNSLVLRGSSSVNWKGNSYSAEVISVDLDTDTILLEGRIQGDIHG